MAALSLGAGSAQAYVVTVGGVQYDVTTFLGKDVLPANAEYTGKFNTPANGGAMPWWENQDLAKQFSEAVGTQLGAINNNNDWGPWFGYTRNPLGGSFRTAYWYYDFNTSIVTDRGDGGDDSGTLGTWAQATLYTPPPVPGPGPLPLFGAGAAFGFSRRLRKRIQAARPQPSAAAEG